MRVKIIFLQILLFIFAILIILLVLKETIARDEFRLSFDYSLKIETDKQNSYEVLAPIPITNNKKVTKAFRDFKTEGNFTYKIVDTLDSDYMFIKGKGKLSFLCKNDLIENLKQFDEYSTDELSWSEPFKSYVLVDCPPNVFLAIDLSFNFNEDLCFGGQSGGSQWNEKRLTKGRYLFPFNHYMGILCWDGRPGFLDPYRLKLILLAILLLLSALDVLVIRKLKKRIEK